MKGNDYVHFGKRSSGQRLTFQGLKVKGEDCFDLRFPTFTFSGWRFDLHFSLSLSQVKWIEFPDSGLKRGEGDVEAAEELLKRGLLAPSGALVVIMVYYIHTYIHTTQFFNFFKFGAILPIINS